MMKMMIGLDLKETNIRKKKHHFLPFILTAIPIQRNLSSPTGAR